MYVDYFTGWNGRMDELNNADYRVKTEEAGVIADDYVI